MHNELRTRYDLLRLELVEKLSRILGLSIMVLVVALLVLAALAMFALALVEVLHTLLPGWAAYLMVGGLYLVLLVLVLCCARRWFVDPMVRRVHAILFSGEEDEDVARVHSMRDLERDIAHLRRSQSSLGAFAVTMLLDFFRRKH